MLNIIVAPNSHNQSGERITKRIVKYLKHVNAEYSVYFSHELADISQTVLSLLSRDETEFAIIGDDKVLSVFINTVKDLSKVKFGIVPIKSNNSFASYLGIEQNPIRAIKDILASNVENVDYLVVNDKKVINNVLIGASVELEELYRQMKFKGYLSKKFIGIKYGDTFDGINLTLQSKNAKPVEVETFELSISNGGYNNDKKVNPLANVKDGLMNVSYVTDLQKNERKKYLSKLKSGKQIYDERTKQIWVNNLTVTNADKKIKAMIDDEIVTLESLDVSLVEGGLKIFMKKG